MTPLLVAAALACLVGELLALPVVIYVAKPVATLAIIAIAWRAHHPVSPTYRALIVAGLVASLAGDVALMLPGDRFVVGLGCFLVAHLLYIGAFASDGGGARDLGMALAVGLIAVAMLLYLWPALGELQLPVLAYVTVIGVMAWQALARWRRLGSEGAAFAAVGAVSFLVSDSALAIRRFRVEFPLASVAVMTTYWLAQWAIARSVARGTAPLPRHRTAP